MPAISPARLKKQASDLASNIGQPVVFIRGLHNLLDYYTDHTHRKGQAGEPSPLLKAYKAPAPVMRQVWLELMPVIKSSPDQALAVCDALWAETNYDLKGLSARILGQLPASMAPSVLTRLQLLVEQGMEKRTMDNLFSLGFETLYKSTPDQLLDLISGWLTSTQQSHQQAGLRAARVLVERTNAEHLPTLNRPLSSFLRVAPSRLRPDILNLLKAMIRCSPAEMAYILRQNLSAPDNPDTAWIIRQVLPEFTESSRSSLRIALKEKI